MRKRTTRNKKRNSIRILGQKFKIVNKNLKDEYGTMHPETRIIEMDLTRKYDYDKVLFHECLHAALAISGITGLLEDPVEEAIVSAIENAFCHAINIDKLK